jgi:translation elongation factor EF-Ts
LGSSGKPADVVEKMTEGRVRKFFQEVRFVRLYSNTASAC